MIKARLGYWIHHFLFSLSLSFLFFLSSLSDQSVIWYPILSCCSAEFNLAKTLSPPCVWVGFLNISRTQPHLTSSFYFSSKVTDVNNSCVELWLNSQFDTDINLLSTSQGSDDGWSCCNFHPKTANCQNLTFCAGIQLLPWGFTYTTDICNCLVKSCWSFYGVRWF